MLRLALCGFAKSHQGGFGAICQVQTGAAVFAKQSPYAGTHGQGPQDLQALHPWQCFASQLRQQALYSQESNSSNKSEQSVARAQQHVNKRGSSHAAEGNPSSAPSSTSNTSSNGSKQGAESRPSRNGGSDSSNSRKPYIGATTAAQHNMRNSVPVPGLQSEAPGKQSRQHQQQQTAVLKQPDHSKHSGQYQHASSGDKITSRQRAQQTEQYYQQKAGAAFQKHNPQQQQQYKVVQYSRGTSLLLALSTDDGGGYVLQKTNGPASAADLAAFGRTKPAKDGAAAAPKPVKEVPLLLRPFQRYLERVKKVLQATFLPSGYPTSVGSNYLEYTLWQV